MKSLFIFLLLFSLQSSVFSQKWFDASDTWVYRISEGLSAIEGFAEYSNARDTIVDGIDVIALDGYFKVYSFSLGRNSEWNNVSLYYEENNKIYAFSIFDGSPYLLYDFNLEVGETISYIRPSPCMEGPPDTLVMHLDSLGVVNIGNEDLAVQNFSYYDETYQVQGELEVIETIGATSNFDLDDILFCSSFHPATERLCAFNTSFGDVQILEEDCYFVISNTDDPQVAQFSYYPNPVNDILQIETEHNDFSVGVYNGSGMLMQEHQNDRAIDVSALPVGLYFVELLADGHRGYARMIKS